MNWKTTAFGVAGIALALLVEPMNQLASGQEVNWPQVLGAVLMGVFAYFAKDKNVSGKK